MTITVKTEINTFDELRNNCWSGAQETLRIVCNQGLEDELLDWLSEFEWDSMTQLNDYLWFDLPDDEIWHKKLYPDE